MGQVPGGDQGASGRDPGMTDDTSRRPRRARQAVGTSSSRPAPLAQLAPAAATMTATIAPISSGLSRWERMRKPVNAPAAGSMLSRTP